jgi:hypothetical protein
MVWTRTDPKPPVGFGLDGAVDWLWPAPDPLTAGTARADGTVLVCDCLGRLHRLAHDGQVTARAGLPEPAVALQGWDVGTGLAWLAVGRSGRAWFLDAALRITAEYDSPDQPWHRLTDRASTPAAQSTLVAVGPDLWLITGRPSQP